MPRQPIVLPAERPGRPAPPEVLARREAMAKAREAGVWRTDAAVWEATLGGVRVLRFQPPEPAKGVVLHMHGGAFRLGCPEQSGPFAAALAARCGVEVVCPAYRLAPEHPFPAGLVDADAVFSALVQEGAGPIILSGDSAGGGLAAGLAVLRTVDRSPALGLVLLSAWLDLTVSSAAYAGNADTDPLFSLEAARAAADLYLQGAAPEHPLASPLFGPLAGFPPTLVSVGTGEVLVDDGRRFYEILRAAQVNAELHAVNGMEHVAVTRGLTLPGAAETFRAVSAFVDSLLPTPSS